MNCIIQHQHTITILIYNTNNKLLTPTITFEHT